MRTAALVEFLATLLDAGISVKQRGGENVMDVREWVREKVQDVIERQSGRSFACEAADDIAPTITKLVEACRAMRHHSDTCQFILITDREIPFPCNCGYALAQNALDELEKP